MSVVVYGIKNCNTMKKTFDWLNAHQIAFEFHDYKKQGIDEALANRLVKHIDLEVLINKRGTTWRKFSEADKESLDKTTAPKLIQQNSSVVKRPIICFGKSYLVGFNEAQLEQAFKS